MTRFLFIRHGESDGNRYGLFTGQGDLPLTKLGHRQADAAAAYVAEQYGNRIDGVYASDLARAWDTGKAAADRLGLPITRTEDCGRYWRETGKGCPLTGFQNGFRKIMPCGCRTLADPAAPEGNP